MGKTTVKVQHGPDTNANQTSIYEIANENHHQNTAFRLTNLPEYRSNNKQHSNLSSSFKIDDILNSTSSNSSLNNLRKYESNDLNCQIQAKNLDNLSDYFQRNQNQPKSNYSSKENSKYNTNRALDSLSSSSSFSSSSSASSTSSSYCSPISSTSSSTSSYPNSIENLISMPAQNEFLLSQVKNNFSSLLNNPFSAVTNGQLNTDYKKLIENNQYNVSSFMDQMVYQQHQQHGHYQNQNYLAIEDLIKNTLSSKILNSDANSGSDLLLNRETETKKKLDMIDEIAKKIDAFSETTHCKNTTSSIKNSQKKQAKMTKKSNETNGKKSKSEKSSKKRAKLLDHFDGNNNEDDEDDCVDGCGCADLACSISSMLPIDQRNLPMCLRGASEEQLHLASLFNTLIHHKKCRRTRTVFTDGQLIGLEKRFENQKYLSTPDRIQLAESLGLSQLQVKTWYQNRRMKWKKKVLKDGSRNAPTKPKGRPKKNSIPSFSEIIQAAAEAAANGKSTGSSSDSVLLNESLDSRTMDEESCIESDLSSDEDDPDNPENDCNGTDSDNDINNNLSTDS